MDLCEFEPVLGLRRKGGGRIGDDRIRLLEAIAACGSISGAARAVGIPYTSAWDAVAALNNLVKRPLVVGHVGGRAGGGTQLTEEGRRFVAATRALEAELRRLKGALERATQNNDLPLNLGWRLAMKTSARNQLRCTVTAIKPGAVNAEVVMTIGDGIPLVAIITGESVKTLELAPGREVFALIKSSFVLLAPEGEVGRISARNVIPGTVVRHEAGAVNSEIVLDIGGGKTLAAIITKESAETLGFAVGSRACALIKASHIILAVA